MRRETRWRRIFRVFRGSLMVVSLVVFPAAREAVAFEVMVTGADAVAGQPLRVLLADGLQKLRPIEEMGAVFDETGKVIVDLEPGQYVFEVLTEDGAGRLVAVRSRVMRVRGPQPVRLDGPRPVTVEAMLDGEPVTVRDVVVRSRGERDRVHVTAGGDGLVRALLSPGEAYRARITAENDETLVAVWDRLWVRNGAGPIRFASRGLREVTFGWRSSETPRNVQVTVHGPTGEITLDDAVGKRLLTNRRLVVLSYRYVDPELGRTVHLRPRGYLLDGRSTPLKLGGELKPIGWTAIIRERVSGGYNFRLVGGAVLADEHGHLVDADASGIDLQARVLLADGRDPPSEPLTEAQREALSKQLEASVRVEAMDPWTGQPLALRPVAPQMIRHRPLQSPMHRPFAWQSACYLAAIDRIREDMQNHSPYPPASPITADWLTNRRRARGGWNGKRDGKKRGHVYMPIHGYHAMSLETDEPSHLIHEVGHTFGHSHGEEMNAVVAATRILYHDHRWRLFDDPGYVSPVMEALLR